ncbi:hypothetical protein Tco_0680305 [Tanacetum coccineum]|uniref:Uncharacterized protein n=1 Tax=Tanacetum coccineum TaxID=301880 RepID=A0ABQ4XL25_9ASTR
MFHRRLAEAMIDREAKMAREAWGLIHDASELCMSDVICITYRRVGVESLISSYIMSSASSAVTYTSVYTDSEPGRVFWGADEEIPDGGLPIKITNDLVYETPFRTTIVCSVQSSIRRTFFKRVKGI